MSSKKEWIRTHLILKIKMINPKRLGESTAEKSDCGNKDKRQSSLQWNSIFLLIFRWVRTFQLASNHFIGRWMKQTLQVLRLIRFFFFYVVEFILLFNFYLLLNARDYLQVEAKSGYLRRIVKENYHLISKVFSASCRRETPPGILSHTENIPL